MKTLCLGGSFNPVHHGHLICARAAAERLGYQRVALIPSAQPPHKSNDANLADAQHRLRMCQLAVANSAMFTVDDRELRRGGKSYTLDTVRELKQTGGWSEVHWLIGADMLNFLPQWHRPLELIRETHFVIMARAGTDFQWETLPSEYQTLKSNVVEVPRIEISSTEIRARVRARLPIDFLTPASVIEYIFAQGLYR